MNDVYDDVIIVAVVPSTIPAPEPSTPTPPLPWRSGAEAAAAAGFGPNGHPVRFRK